MRQPAELGRRPEPSTSTPALAISSWNPTISFSRLSGGILPASESRVAFTRIMNLIAISLKVGLTFPSRTTPAGFDSPPRFLLKARHAPLEEAALGLLAAKLERLAVRHARIVVLPQAPTQVGARRVGEVVVPQIAFQQ